MDQARLVAKVLSDVAAARSAIAASYWRLWRLDTDAVSDPGDTPPGPELGPGEEAGRTGEEASSS